MKITKIEITNYRLLKDFSVDIEENLSLLIGKNNTGKTSFLLLLEKFLKTNADTFSFDDFNLDFQNKIKITLDNAKEENFTYDPLKISLKIVIEYSEEDNLKNIPILNLNPEQNMVIISFDYIMAKEKFEQLKKDLVENNPLELNSLDFLKKNNRRYFDKEIMAIDPDDVNNFSEIKYADISKIINLQTISAKRGVANEDGDSQKSNKILSRLSHRYFEKSDDPCEQHRIDLQKTLIKTDEYLTKAYYNTFKKITTSIEKFSYDASKITIKSVLEAVNVLRDNTTVVYDENGTELPEDYTGLGYMNLFAIIFSLHIICDEFKKQNQPNEEPADINLLFIEEPEAHTHPQMQYVFIKNIKKLLKEEKGELKNLQTIITTHSAHITSQSDFNDIKYFLNKNGSVSAKNLADLEKKYSSEEEEKDDEEKRNFKFLKQYLTLHKSELFFADKIVFVEGDTERILLPAIFKKIDDEHSRESDYKPLLSQNISMVDVGANSKAFEKLLDFLEIKTLIITDIDSAKIVNQTDKDGKTICNKDSTPKTKRVPCKVSEGGLTSNASINFFLEDKKDDFDTLKNLPENEKIRSKDNGAVAKSNFQSSELVLRLINGNIIKKIDSDSDCVCFGDSITNENQLRTCLNQIEGIEIEPILAIWRQSHNITKKWVKSDDGQIYITFQTEENGYHARSFEDAFFALNLDFIKSKKDNFSSLKNKSKLEEAPPDYYQLAQNCIDKKTDFATDILFFCKEDFSDWLVPKYIINGLLWLAK